MYVCFRRKIEANYEGPDWTQEDAENPKGNPNLWEESWDDDDINEDFSAQLKYVLYLSIHMTISQAL